MPSWLRSLPTLLPAGPQRSGAAPAAAPKPDASSSWGPKDRPSALTIFDWDDTLLCTSFLKDASMAGRGQPVLAFGGLGMAPPGLRRVEDAACRLLAHALAAGPVYIVTNAKAGWVEQSAGQHLPRLLPLLRNAKIVSARSCFGEQFPGDFARWKVHAFLEVAKDARMDDISNLVVVGDSDFEMRAADAVGGCFESVRIKAFKLTEIPSANDLAHELQLVLQSFDAILRADRDLTVHLECAGRPSSTSASAPSPPEQKTALLSTPTMTPHSAPTAKVMLLSL